MLLRCVIVGAVLVLIVLPMHSEAFLHLGLNLQNTALDILILGVAGVTPRVSKCVRSSDSSIVLNVVCSCLQLVMGHFVNCHNGCPRVWRLGW